MADKKKTLSDLGALTSETPEAPAPAHEAIEAEGSETEAGETAVAEAPAKERRSKDAPVEDHGVSTQGPQMQAVLREQQLDKHGRAYATGRRKDAVARVWLKPGANSSALRHALYS